MRLAWQNDKKYFGDAETKILMYYKTTWLKSVLD
jgi:hypothetical protein